MTKRTRGLGRSCPQVLRPAPGWHSIGSGRRDCRHQHIETLSADVVMMVPARTRAPPVRGKHRVHLDPLAPYGYASHPCRGRLQRTRPAMEGRMDVTSLPTNADLAQLRAQAKELRRAFAGGSPAVVARVRAALPD